MISSSVLVVDDHPVVREGIRCVLIAGFPNARIGEAACGEGAMTLLRKDKWDMVLLDVSLPGQNGFEVLHRIRELENAPPVLVLSMHSEEVYGVQALRAGAAGFLTKDASSDEFLRAVDIVGRGRRYISGPLAERLASEMQKPFAYAPHERLSGRELEVLRLIGSGLTVSEIAERLGLSSKTVGTYRARLLAKMDMASNAELTHYAIRYGITSRVA